jgi:imidazolonepropionase-like amidohydrolase
MRAALMLCLALAPGACAGANQASPKPVEVWVDTDWVDNRADLPTPPEPAPAEAAAAPAPAPAPLIVRNATILTAAGQRFDGGALVVTGGRISYVGDIAGAPSATGAREIDAAGKFVTPGIIDTHSHIGVYSEPSVLAHSDGNEATAPVAAQVRAEWAYWPQDPAISRAAAGGVTTMLVLPGSANLIGGRGVTVVPRIANNVEEVRFPGAPPTLKMACGENPKHAYGDKGGPQTRMAIYAEFRAAFQQAAEYRAKRAAYRRARAVWEQKRDKAAKLAAEGKKTKPEPAPEPLPFDAKLDYLARVLDGEVLVQVHCYKAAEIREMVRVADEFGFRIRSFHHALGAYKIRDLLVTREIAISTWADWWGFKLEAFDGIMENAALFAEAGGRTVIHSDSNIGVQRLNQEAAKAMQAGRAAGIDISEDQALRWVTANPAWVLGIDGETGTLEQGKRADLVIWSAHPFSVYALPELVVSGGAPIYDRDRGMDPTDFELGNSALDMGERR